MAEGQAFADDPAALFREEHRQPFDH
jgi:hypothetical protein